MLLWTISMPLFNYSGVYSYAYFAKYMYNISPSNQQHWCHATIQFFRIFRVLILIKHSSQIQACEPDCLYCFFLVKRKWMFFLQIHSGRLAWDIFEDYMEIRYWIKSVWVMEVFMHSQVSNAPYQLMRVKLYDCSTPCDVLWYRCLVFKCINVVCTTCTAPMLLCNISYIYKVHKTCIQFSPVASPGSSWWN